MRVVLDTNVLIDGFKDEYSYEHRILEEIINGGLEAFANHQTLRENRLIMRQLIDNPDYEQEVAKFFSQLNHVANRRQIRVVPDREDNKILESAVEAKADYLITSDSDLLNLVEFRGIQIVRPVQFWAKYKDEGQDLWKQWTSFIGKQ